VTDTMRMIFGDDRKRSTSTIDPDQTKQTTISTF
jgi:hypothetical protein